MTGEFEEGCVDFEHNSTCFNLKLLTEIRKVDRSKSILNSTYAKAIKTAVAELNIPSFHAVHNIGEFLDHVRVNWMKILVSMNL